jgi:hypothetical protein
MLDQANQDNAREGEADARGEALRKAAYAPLTRRAVTDNGCELVDEVLRLITAVEARERQRVSKVDALKQAIAAFLGDLLAATDPEGHAGWVHRPVSPRYFPDGGVSHANFTAVRKGLKKVGLLEERPPVQFWSPGLGVTARWCHRFRATPPLKLLAAQHGIQPTEASKHFIHIRSVRSLPKHPLRRKSASTRGPGGRPIRGKLMKIDYADPEVQALAQVIRGLNIFLDQFVITGGIHHGYVRQFECGAHKKFAWDLGGRSPSYDNYQQVGRAKRLKMTINGKPLCELDIRASTFTIFQALGGEPLDFVNDPDLDPYALPGFRREVVKALITATFGQGQLPGQWPQKASRDYRAGSLVEGEGITGKSLGEQYPIALVRDTVAGAYPLLAKLQQDSAEPPIWAQLQYWESEVVLRTMLDLQAAGIPSLTVHDSLLVPLDAAQLTSDIMKKQFHSVIGAIPHIVPHLGNSNNAEQDMQDIAVVVPHLRDPNNAEQLREPEQCEQLLLRRLTPGPRA